MRFIAQSAEPAALRQWKRKETINQDYESLPSDIKDKIKGNLLKEQGHLCAYTMRRLDGPEQCHVEHIQPQNQAPGLDLDYANMVACFPKDGGDVTHGYGAPVKHGHAVELNITFISPHQRGCGERFLFDDKGGITPARAEDQAAKKTIELLKLDHDTLNEERHAVMVRHGLALPRGLHQSRGVTLKSAAQARKFAREVLTPDRKEQLEPYCVALAQVAEKHAARLESMAQRKRGTTPRPIP